MQIITHLCTLLSFCCVYLHEFLCNTLRKAYGDMKSILEHSATKYFSETIQ